jgi:hypothetical protein
MEASMKSQRFVVVLTVLNVVILFGVIASRAASVPASAPASGVLRGSGLEIVDEQGHVRASISVHGPTTVDGRQYPGAVVLRMRDPDGPPGVKLAVSADGAGLNLSNGERVGDGQPVGIQMRSDDPVVILRDKQGKERVVKP